MSKRASDGEVLNNRFNLAVANSQNRLAALLGPKPESHATSSAVSKPETEDEDFKKDLVDPEQLGVGGIRPKEFEDGSFTKRTLTSSDKLLEQLIGKKKAKAHLASKQQAERLGSQQQTTRLSTQAQPKNGRGTAMKKEDSDDEEEGRAATFKSKRRRTNRPASAEEKDESSVEDDGGAPKDEEVEDEKPIATPIEDRDDQIISRKTSKQIPSRSKPKPTSYLDELLASRASKKKKKNGNSTGKGN